MGGSPYPHVVQTPALNPPVPLLGDVATATNSVAGALPSNSKIESGANLTF
jgi:hypothetical protein